MIKGFKTLFIIFSLVSGCIIKPNSDKRKEIIAKFISAAKNFDTTEIYTLIDTSSYFKVQDKDGLLYQIDYLNRRFKVCESKITDSLIKIRESSVHSNEYVLPFCRNEKGEVNDDSFDLIFTFTNYGNEEKIHYLDIVKYRQSNTTPIQSFPKTTIPK